MIANALFLTVALLLAYGFWLLDALKFMAPYKAVLFHAYGRTLLLATGVLFLNVFGATLAVYRKFLLKDTGRKLTHLDREFQADLNRAPEPPPELPEEQERYD